MKPLPQVLLVEDDTAIRAWVTMVLEDLPIDLVGCTNLGETRRWLQAAATAPQLMLLDLMLPDGSGIDLLKELGQWPAERRPAHIVLMSASSSLPAQLQQVGPRVDQVLAKPVAVDELVACVQHWLGAFAHAHAVVPQPSSPPPEELDVIDRFFGGDKRLHRSFVASCQAQFGSDIDVGDTAIRAGDVAAICLVGHNLKAVFRLLGYTQLAELAACLELGAEHEANFSLPVAAEQWLGLRQGLLDMTLV